MIYEIFLKSSKLYLLTIFISFLKQILVEKNYGFVEISLPNHVNKISIIKSSHVHKKSKEHYETKIYSKKVFIKAGCIYNFEQKKLFQALLSFKPIEVNCKINIIK